MTAVVFDGGQRRWTQTDLGWTYAMTTILVHSICGLQSSENLFAMISATAQASMHMQCIEVMCRCILVPLTSVIVFYLCLLWPLPAHGNSVVQGDMIHRACLNLSFWPKVFRSVLSTFQTLTLAKLARLQAP
jgi:hypothetical protein